MRQYQAEVGETVHCTKEVLDRFYEMTGVVIARRSDRGLETIVVQDSNGKTDAFPLDGSLSTTIEPAQPTDARCRRCGETGVEMTRIVTYQNYGEDGEPDDGGCFTDEIVEWQCADSSACLQRRREMAHVVRRMAIDQDAAAREDGFGAIGGHHG